MEGKEVVEPSEWLHALSTVMSSRTDLFITARTDALAVHGIDDAIERGRMARDLGVDAVFIEAPQSIQELEAIAAALPDVPLVANMVEKGKTPLLTPGELLDLGFALVVSPLSGLLAATRALGSAYDVLFSQGTMRTSLGDLTSFDDFTDLVGLSKYLDNAAPDR
ncbi:unannotated protein [freshwater metagenome]|uniref:Unannotated protein n=1 Tax=freshwater metagenome TaxID=449393 RepID=A0A6J6H813_9ZZZZ|nr:hypothetical protein [Actinomycetota bacterium]